MNTQNSAHPFSVFILSSISVHPSSILRVIFPAVLHEARLVYTISLPICPNFSLSNVSHQPASPSPSLFASVIISQFHASFYPTILFILSSSTHCHFFLAFSSKKQQNKQTNKHSFPTISHDCLSFSCPLQHQQQQKLNQMNKYSFPFLYNHLS